MSPLRIVALLALGVAAWGLHTLWIAGVFRDVERRFEGRCVAVPGVPGPEDLTLHPTRPLAYVSGYDRAAVAAGDPARGGVYAYDFGGALGVKVGGGLAAVERRGPGTLSNLTPDADADFRPHGLSLFAGPDGALRLFVIDHAGGGHAIQVYDVRGDSLVHAETLRHPLLVSPNDLVAVGPREAYVTNDHRYSEGILGSLENWLRLPISTVIHYRGAAPGASQDAEFSVAIDGIGFPNGINVSADGREVYVASTLGRELRVYARDPATGDLEAGARVPLASGADNVERDAEGRLWIGAHPKILALASYMAGDAPTAPSQVLRVQRSGRGGGGDWEVDEVYLDPGDELSGSSVAAVRGRRMLIGAIRTDHFLDCELP